MNHDNIPQFIKNLKLLFIFFLAGQVLFGGVVWWLLLNWPPAERPAFSSQSFVAVIILGWMTIAAFVLYRQRLKRGVLLKSLPLKASHYRTSCIFRWAMLELGNLAVIFIAFMEVNSRLMLLFAIGMAIFFLTAPSREVFERSYER